MTSLKTWEVDENSALKAEGIGAIPPWFAAQANEPLGEGMAVNRFDFSAETEQRLRIAGPPTLSISMFFDGAGSLSIDGGRPLEIRPGTTVLYHANRPTVGEDLIPAGARVFCLDFRYEARLLTGLGLAALPVLIRGFATDCSVRDVLLLGRPTSTALEAVGRSVLACRLTGTARQVFLKAKALEALAWLIAEIDGAPPVATLPVPAERRRIEHAARLLVERHDEAWTIPLLARTVGLNEKKLKSGFRLVIGRTVHGHLEAARLDAAARMIEDGARVIDAAVAVGYTNPSHFARLFRRRFGAAPADWRRGMLMPDVVRPASLMPDEQARLRDSD
ncbi:AraC family transcriptional regulator [Tistrella mobilis]|uniref:helix-turn-helix transcriptional regulator n=1 Tax=Tistrella mobilis TaxID=171437 RepID=UPI00355816EF